MSKNVQALMDTIDEFQKIIGYKYKDPKFYLLALTHSSYANENREVKLKSNERIEFLGDSILSLSISEYLYMNCSKLAEGDLTRVRATLVCEGSLVKCANKLSIGSFLLLGKGEESTGGRMRPSVLSDAFEAIIGSIYLDGGLKDAKQFVIRQLEQSIREAVSGSSFTDYKTQFQETIQKNGSKKITYKIIDEKGPDHSKYFVAQVDVEGSIVGTGEGKSKKEAEQMAAKTAIEKL